VHYRYFGDDTINIRVEQGYEIKRPSILHLKAALAGDHIEVNVGGKAFLVAKGELV
jgi:trans-2,3-dihydro-3-hydroxyanthranilate isomerase